MEETRDSNGKIQYVLNGTLIMDSYEYNDITHYVDYTGGVFATGRIEGELYVIRDRQGQILETSRPAPKPAPPPLDPPESILDQLAEKYPNLPEHFRDEAIRAEQEEARFRRNFLLAFGLMVLAILPVFFIKQLLIPRQNPDQVNLIYGLLLITCSLLSPACYGFFLHFRKQHENAGSTRIYDTQMYDAYKNNAPSPRTEQLTALYIRQALPGNILRVLATLLELGMLFLQGKAFWDQIHISVKAAAVEWLGISALLNLTALILALYVNYRMTNRE